MPTLASTSCATLAVTVEPPPPTTETPTKKTFAVELPLPVAVAFIDAASTWPASATPAVVEP